MVGPREDLSPREPEEVATVRTVLLFWLLTWVTGNPILAGAIIMLIFGGSYLLYSRRLYRFRQAWREVSRIRELRAELAVNPENAKARSDLGEVLARKGRFREALAHLEKAITRCDDQPDTNFYLGWTHLALGDLEQGRRYNHAGAGAEPTVRVWRAPSPPRRLLLRARRV